MRLRRKPLWFCLPAAIFALWFAKVAVGDTIVFSGGITQSTPDGTGPADNNTSLNNIQDLQTYTVTLVFPGSITGPGTYDLTGSALTFSVPSAPATETGFSFTSLTVTPNAGFDEISLLGCLTSGSGCFFGNELDANFRIPIAMLNSQNVSAVGLDQPHPLDLLEDDGVTGIQGSITDYSYRGAVSTVPEPSSLILLGSGLAAVALTRSLRSRARRLNSR